MDIKIPLFPVHFQLDQLAKVELGVEVINKQQYQIKTKVTVPSSKLKLLRVLPNPCVIDPGIGMGNCFHIRLNLGNLSSRRVSEIKDILNALDCTKLRILAAKNGENFKIVKIVTLRIVEEGRDTFSRLDKKEYLIQLTPLIRPPVITPIRLSSETRLMENFWSCIENT